MPKLHGYRERTMLNIYDCVSPRTLLSGYCRLFGNSNIGHLVKTNIQVPGRISSDHTAVIANWYARTNIDTTLPAWRAWTNATVVTFVVGSHSVLQRSLYELMANVQGGNGMTANPLLASTASEFAARREKIARRTAMAFLGADDPAVFDALSDGDKERWYVAARAAIGHSQVPLAIIPVRQSYSVTIESEQSATRALLETMPTNVAPQALVWVHLEGVQSRDVA